MRGGPRLMCSPYLTGSLGIMLCLVTFNYWSVSTQNSDLVKKAEEMQQQLQLGSKHIHSLEEEIRDVRKQVKSCKEKLTEERELKKDVEFKSLFGNFMKFINVEYCMIVGSRGEKRIYT